MVRLTLHLNNLQRIRKRLAVLFSDYQLSQLLPRAYNRARRETRRSVERGINPVSV
jgi:hypothetical protein